MTSSSYPPAWKSKTTRPLILAMSLGNSIRLYSNTQPDFEEIRWIDTDEMELFEMKDGLL